MFEQEKKTLFKKKKNLKSECWPKSEYRRRCEGRISILPWQSAEKKNQQGPERDPGVPILGQKKRQGPLTLP